MKTQKNVHDKIHGLHEEVWGDFRNITGFVGNIKGCVSANLKGDVSKIRGDVSGVRGNVELIEGGDVSGLYGNLDILPHEFRQDVSPLSGPTGAPRSHFENPKRGHSSLEDETEAALHPSPDDVANEIFMDRVSKMESPKRHKP